MATRNTKRRVNPPPHRLSSPGEDVLGLYPPDGGPEVFYDDRAQGMKSAVERSIIYGGRPSSVRNYHSDDHGGWVSGSLFAVETDRLDATKYKYPAGSYHPNPKSQSIMSKPKSKKKSSKKSGGAARKAGSLVDSPDKRRRYIFSELDHSALALLSAIVDNERDVIFDRKTTDAHRELMKFDLISFHSSETEHRGGRWVATFLGREVDEMNWDEDDPYISNPRRPSDKLRDQESPSVFGQELDRDTLTPHRRYIDTRKSGDHGADPLGEITWGRGRLRGHSHPYGPYPVHEGEDTGGNKWRIESKGPGFTEIYLNGEVIKRGLHDTVEAKSILSGFLWRMVPSGDIVGANERECRLKNPNQTRKSKMGKDKDYYRMHLILPHDESIGDGRSLAEQILDWHGGQWSKVYSLGSIGMSGFVSAAMIDAAIDELRSDLARNKTYEKNRRWTRKEIKELKELIANLEMVTSYPEGFSAEEAGFDEDETVYGYSTWLMEQYEDDDEYNPNPSEREAASVYIFLPGKKQILIAKESIPYSALTGGAGFGSDSYYEEMALEYARVYPDHVIRIFVVPENSTYSYRAGSGSNASALFLGKKPGRPKVHQDFSAGYPREGYSNNPRRSYMTKREFEEMFRSEVLPEIVNMYEQDGIPDKPARREEWNNTVDAYIKDGQLPESAGDWSHPRWLESRSHNPSARHYQISEWVEAEVDSFLEADIQEQELEDIDDFELPKSLYKAQERYTKNANRVVNKWIDSLPEDQQNDIRNLFTRFESEDDIAWNTYAAQAGHGVGFWEDISEELNSELEAAIEKDKNLAKSYQALQDAMFNAVDGIIRNAKNRSRNPSHGRMTSVETSSPVDTGSIRKIKNRLLR